MKILSPHKLILGHVNINLIRNKLDSFIYMLDKNIDNFLISETRLDDSLPSAQFKIEGFTTPYRYVRKDKGGGLLFYIRQDIPLRLLQSKSHCNIYDINCLKSLIKEPICFKNPEKPTCIGFIFTNRPNLFQYRSDFETGLSNFHLLTVTEFKMGFQKLKPKIIVYRDYKNFDNAKFRYDIVTATSNVYSFAMYKNTIFNVYNRHIPIKKKYIRANGAPFTSKELH